MPCAPRSGMSILGPVKRSAITTRRRAPVLLHLIVTVALVYAGIVQAAHFHKSEFSGHGKAAQACEICLHSGQGAVPPAVMHTAEVLCSALIEVCETQDTAPRSVLQSSYRARGPPLS